MCGYGHNNGGNEDITVDYTFEDQSFTFETKPMGFQIKAENGKISVRSVRELSIAGNYGIKQSGTSFLSIRFETGHQCWAFCSVFIIYYL